MTSSSAAPGGGVRPTYCFERAPSRRRRCDCRTRSGRADGRAPRSASRPSCRPSSLSRCRAASPRASALGAFGLVRVVDRAAPSCQYASASRLASRPRAASHSAATFVWPMLLVRRCRCMYMTSASFGSMLVRGEQRRDRLRPLLARDVDPAAAGLRVEHRRRRRVARSYARSASVVVLRVAARDDRRLGGAALRVEVLRIADRRRPRR